jgi:hypothetical protein
MGGGQTLEPFALADILDRHQARFGAGSSGHALPILIREVAQPIGILFQHAPQSLLSGFVEGMELLVEFANLLLSGGWQRLKERKLFAKVGNAVGIARRLSGARAMR